MDDTVINVDGGLHSKVDQSGHIHQPEWIALTDLVKNQEERLTLLTEICNKQQEAINSLSDSLGNVIKALKVIHGKVFSK